MRQVADSDLIWPVQVQCGSELRSFWLATSSLQRLVIPEPGPVPPPAVEYKRDVIAYKAANRSGKIILVGAWVSEPGHIVCDWVQYQPEEERKV